VERPCPSTTYFEEVGLIGFNRSMFRRLGLTISYFIAIVYFLAIVLPSIYCLRHGCRGPGELDAFMPAFGLTPVGAIATAFSLRNAIQQIRRRQSWSWVFWPLAIVFAIVLLGAIAFIAWVIYQTASHR
jgi:Ni/Fe-hydrogenase subunit HybB-like protein